jgi:hypothetical protein
LLLQTMSVSSNRHTRNVNYVRRCAETGFLTFPPCKILHSLHVVMQ